MGLEEPVHRVGCIVQEHLIEQPENMYLSSEPRVASKPATLHVDTPEYRAGRRLNG